MSIPKSGMKTIIKRNGHLIVEGDETTDELREALLFLHRHTSDKCHKLHLGIPINILLPDIGVLVPTSMRYGNARPVSASTRDGK